MRRPLSIASLLTTCAVALSACGSSATHTRRTAASAASPTASALSYFPADAPLVALVDTDPHGAMAKQIKAEQAPTAALGKAAAFQELAKLGIDYNRDVRPLFGKPIAAGVSAAPGGHSPHFLLSWQTANATALKRLVTDDLHAKPAGSHAGATLYTVHGAAVALEGSLVLAAGSVADVSAALDRHAAGSGFSATTYRLDLGPIPDGAPITVVGDPRPLLADPTAAVARRVPWVAALTGYGAAFSQQGHTGVFQMHARTDGRSLTASQLPLATGTAAPGLAGVLPIAVGLRDPAQLWTFGSAVTRVVDPQAYAKLRRGEARSQREGVDLEHFISKFTGEMALTSDTHTTIARFQVTDPSYVAATLKRMSEHPIDPISGGKPDRYTSLGGGLYRVQQHGSPTDTLVFGMVGDTAVLGRGSPNAVRAYARAATDHLGGAAGALAFRISVSQLLALTMHGQVDPSTARLLTHVGPLTGSVLTAPDGMTATARVTFNPAG